MFGSKTQHELDAAFLEAVANHNFKKAGKFLASGANILAVDAEGNTALHKLAGKDYAARFGPYPSEIDEFVCRLINNQLDINVRNNRGQTCLHIIAGKPYHSSSDFVNLDSKKLMEIFIERGADVRIKDNAGCTPLHVAAATGDSSMILACLDHAPALVATQDQDGKYPWNYAADGGHHVRSQSLLQRLENYNSSLKAKAVAAKPKKATQDVSADEEWTWLKPKPVVQHVEVMGNYRLTHIFNFNVRTYTHITYNLETKLDVPVVKGFDEFPDKALFIEARHELMRLGGQVDESVIYNQQLPEKNSASPLLKK